MNVEYSPSRNRIKENHEWKQLLPPLIAIMQCFKSALAEYSGAPTVNDGIQQMFLAHELKLRGR
jgi:hypothetical protein